jgi:peptidoglycan/LPS O-acetylase OafA/YrhL
MIDHQVADAERRESTTIGCSSGRGVELNAAPGCSISARHVPNVARIHFPGLNGLRFYAALLVVLSHLEVAKSQLLGVPSVFDLLPLQLDVGSLAVRFFFVLSGFLITYLLLAERDAAGDIDVPRFYLRRALRIFPLYYLIVLIAFSVFPLLFPGEPLYDLRRQTHVLRRLLLYLAFLPNFGLVPSPLVPGAGHLWSIGVEEQFYWVWPAVLKLFPAQLPRILIALIVVKTAVVALLGHLLAANLGPAGGAIGFLRMLYTWTFLPIEYMAIGGLGADAVFRRREALLRIALHPWVERVNLFVLLPSVFVMRIGVPSLLIGVIFLVLILNVACNERSLVRLDDRFHRHAGDLSYGVYMYHPLVMFAALAALRESPTLLGEPLLLHALLYPIVLGGTYLISVVSFRTFEGFFLGLKKRFAIVESSPAG